MKHVLTALIALLLIACGGGPQPEDTPQTAYCALPAEQSAFSMACATSAYVSQHYAVTVEITGKVSANGTFERYVSAGIGGDGYQGRYIRQAGEFRIVHTVTSDTFGGPRWVDIGLSSLEMPGARSELSEVSVKVTATQR